MSVYLSPVHSPKLSVYKGQVRKEPTYDRPSQPPSHKCEAQKQHKSRLPRHSRPRIAVTIRTQPRLLYRVDDQHPKRGAYPRDPIDEFDVDV